MKISAKISKRLRFYTMMIACSAFLWMMVRNNWIDLNTLGGYAFLVFLVIVIMVFLAAGCAFVIRYLIQLKDDYNQKSNDEKR